MSIQPHEHRGRALVPGHEYLGIFICSDCGKLYGKGWEMPPRRK